MPPTVILVVFVILGCILALMLRTRPVMDACDYEVGDFLSIAGVLFVPAIGVRLLTTAPTAGMRLTYVLMFAFFYYVTYVAYTRWLGVYADWLNRCQAFGALDDIGGTNPFTDKRHRVIYLTLLFMHNAAVGTVILAGATYIATQFIPSGC